MSAETNRLAPRLGPERPDEAGFAMIVGMVVVTVLLVMTLAMLATGIHLTQATSRDRQWNLALQAAEAGVDKAVYMITKNAAYTGTSSPESVFGGQYETTVTSPQLGYLTVTSTGYVPSKTATNVVKRKVQVQYGPYASFKYALFSTSSLNVFNNAVVSGDVWANQSLSMGGNAVVVGSVYSATGTVAVGNNSCVLQSGNDPAKCPPTSPVSGTGGGVYSGGYDSAGGWGINLGANSYVQASAHAQAPSCPQAANYNIVNAGTIHGDAVAPGTINGTVDGQRLPGRCEVRFATKSLPTFHWAPDLFPGANTYSSAAQFQTWLNANYASMTGVHYVNDPNPADIIDIPNNATITNNFTLITTTRIAAKNNFGYNGPASAFIEIVSLNTSTDPANPAIQIVNNFQMTTPTPGQYPAALIYSMGLIDVKNNPVTQGALYAGAVSFNNNFTTAYDPRVERAVGFGPVRYDRISWQELPA